MKLRKTMTAAVLWSTTSVGVAAPPPPPLDRPTPPPCCADGLCYPKCDSWGWYQTRWRRWPTYMEAAAPGVTPPAPLGPDTPSYVTPPAEDEDEQAPEPTKPPEAPIATPTTPGGSAPTTGPAGGPGSTTTPLEERPSSSLLQPGGPNDTPLSNPTGLGPAAPGDTDGIPMLPLQSTPPTSTPSTSPGGIQPLGEPTGDLDPPPALPKFGAPVQREDVARGPRLLQPRTDRAPAAARRPAANDPPPALPGTFASVLR